MIIRFKVLPEQEDYIQVSINMDRFKRAKEWAFWKLVAVYLYGKNTLDAFIEWLRKR